MKLVLTRGRLLSGSAMAVAGTLSLASPAHAQCVVEPSAVTCDTTTTTDTTNVGGSPASDRNYNVDTAGAAFTGTVVSDATVDGYGLAFTQTVNDLTALDVLNDGAVQVDAGLTPTAGGSAALGVTAFGDAAVSYSGAGDIVNSGFGNGLEFGLQGTNSLSANVGGSVTSGTGAFPGGIGIGVQHSGTAGDVSVVTTEGETVTADSAGIYINGTNAAYTGNIGLVNNSEIASLDGAGSLDFGLVTQTAGTGSVSISNGAGNIGSATDRIGTGGIVGQILNNASEADLSITTGEGQVWSGGTSIFANNQGGGSVTVTTGSGAVDAAAGAGGTGIATIATSGATIISVGSGGVTSNGDGIVSVSTTGAQTINVGGQVAVTEGGFDGINATSDTGALTVNVLAGGGIDAVDDAISLTSDGTKAVNIAAGTTVTGAYGVYTNGTGPTTIVNGGTLTGTDITILAGALTDGAITITNQAGATLSGRVDLTDGDDSLTNAGTFNAEGEQAFYAGTDTLTNQAGGTINVAEGVSFTGLETFSNAGTVNAATGLLFDAGDTALNNTGTLNVTGAIDLGDGTDSFSNTGAGVLNLTGDASIVGAETFTSSGRVNLNSFALTGTGAFNNTGTVDTSGNASLLGFTSFSNSGTLDLAAGTFTVPAAVFTNSGTILADEGASTITGQTSFANTGTIDLQDGAVGDVLTIDSAFAGSGGSNLLVDFNETTADRLVINGAASGLTTLDATYVGSGLINLSGVLVVDATSASPGAFVLGTVGGNTSPLIDYSLVQNGGDFLLVSAPNASAFDPLALAGFGRSLWYQSADEVIAQTRLPATTVGASFWGQIYLSRDKYDDDSVQTVADSDFDIDRNIKTKRRGIQIGADYGFGGGRVGLTGGLARAKADDRGDTTDIGLKARGWNVGVYGQFGGATGLHGEFLAKHDRYKLDFNSGAFDGEDTKARANGIDGSIGYRFGMGGAATLDANAGVSFVRTKFDDINAFGFGYDLDTVKSTRGRAGLRATFGGSMSPYIDGTVYREFRGDGRIALFDGASIYDLESRGKATWFRLEGGVLPNPTGLMLAAWADLGDRKGLGARLGFRFGGAPVAAAAPAPLPPAPVAPPAPPATQTCPDGSVILATDSCPLPPPPPPPPPPAPERG